MIINIMLEFLLLILIFLIAFNSCNKSYFGSGPEIFDPYLNGEPTFLNPEKLEPVYVLLQNK